MKKIFIVILLVLLTGCKANVVAVSDYQALDNLLEDKKNGQFRQAIAYDLREREICDAGHIDGFMCVFYHQTFNIDTLTAHVKQVYDKTTTIILICDDGTTSLSFAQTLKESGYRNVYYFVGGYQEYTKQNENFIPKVGCDC